MAGQPKTPGIPIPPLYSAPSKIRGLILKNRIMVAPMCMYSAQSDPSSPFVGALTNYHIAHLGHLALKGAGLIIIEATAVQPNGRISPNDSGLWQEGTESEQFQGLKRVVDFVHSQGAKIAIQLAHAGRKASTTAPWVAKEAGKRSLRVEESVGGWPDNVVGPSGGAEHIWAPGDGFWAPRELMDAIEIHGAHGYLISQFLSPVTNQRTDKYGGGSFENRTRILREIAAAIRAVIPADMPLFLRISATEWLDGKVPEFWDLPSSIALAKLLPELGIDFLDVSSGGNHKDQVIEPHTHYQIDLASKIRKEIRQAGQSTLVGAVGLITQLTGSQPEADAVLLGRQFLREADWVINAAKKLGVSFTAPWQLGRAV
ncbi:hypothetical protein BDV27DRAFT_172151 [Aspergillus caelatus]|uniref:NADH:flavin oxidoreductase/NADH oxidase N-terminal domain-containing protein n=1 Tax=Aspergillus caelatus TaxID=61420 RepID=A0A5N7A4C9_9EURO|nr:uncharacterized protein BDV27DRAFT_172151 [Aspergillus caelatus]KAE8364707.1 hypothetical protein BDV27DRAFT_172151 [Aspergillus caelatus]